MIACMQDSLASVWGADTVRIREHFSLQTGENEGGAAGEEVLFFGTEMREEKYPNVWRQSKEL